MNPKYAAELIKMEELDLSVRERLFRENKLSSGYNLEMQKVHQSNAKRLREIIAEIGYPTISKVGEKASNSAWLIIQHSISEPNFMKNSYELMLQNKADICLSNIAYLYDRIQFFQGKPQKFGTQFNADASIFPVENKTNINEYRAEYNLPPLSTEEIEKIPSTEQIDALENQDPDYILWRKEVRWK